MTCMDGSSTSWSTLLFRLGLALAAGGLIGWERHAAGKSAGLRTHMLVCVGAAIFVMTAQQASNEAATRVIQGVATGIGFLGAGEIVHDSSQSVDPARVKGLTSAAGIWVAAALGVSAGYGAWRVAIIGAAVTALILTVAKRLEQGMVGRHPTDLKK